MSFTVNNTGFFEIKGNGYLSTISSGASTATVVRSGPISFSCKSKNGPALDPMVVTWATFGEVKLYDTDQNIITYTTADVTSLLANSTDSVDKLMDGNTEHANWLYWHANHFNVGDTFFKINKSNVEYVEVYAQTAIETPELTITDGSGRVVEITSDKWKLVPGTDRYKSDKLQLV